MSAPASAAGTLRATRKLDDDDCCVKVAVNIRPLIDIELAAGAQEALYVPPGQPQVLVGPHAFTYDNVYGCGGGDLERLYPECVQPLMEGLFKGYNATVFAYGQTGSGKTYTMGSGFTPGEESRGVIPAVMEELFGRISAAPDTDFTVRVSFVEIHREEVRDLLFTDLRAPRPVVSIRELPTGVSLAGAIEKEVRSKEEMLALLEQGSICRAVASTNMNNRSSRSHAIFTITLEQRRQPRMVTPAAAANAGEQAPAAAGEDSPGGGSSSEEEDAEEVMDEAADDYLIAKMHLVDLAGSERAKRTGAEGARLKEAININKGLLALAKVISALVDNQAHVPYRDSKLTRLLQDSLGGNSRTVMVACVSPADVNREETLNTLRYADRARHIKNKPVVNRDPVAAQLAALRQQNAQLRAENAALKRTLGGDAGVAAALAAGSMPPAEVLQQAYDDLAMQHDKLQSDTQRMRVEMEAMQEEVAAARQQLLTAETQRDTHLLHLQRLQRAVAESSDEALRERAGQEQAAAAASIQAAAGGEQANGSTQQQHVDPDVDIISSLRSRIAELEQEKRQLQVLQRATSTVLSRGNSAVGRSRLALDSTIGTSTLGGSTIGATSRGGSTLGGSTLGGSTLGGRLGATAELSDWGMDSVPMTPTGRMSEAADGGAEVADDSELIASATAHMVGQEQLKLRLAVLGRQMHAKQERLAALQKHLDDNGIKAQYMAQLNLLQTEKKALEKERTNLQHKLQSIAKESAEERKRLEQQYKEKLLAVERRVRELREKEEAHRRNNKHLLHVENVCQQLQRDIERLKSQKSSFQRHFEQKEREFREWRIRHEREVQQLQRRAARQNAVLQQHVNMHAKQQAVLKRKTEEAEAARKRIRELLELQQSKRLQRAESTSNVECQPNAAAPLLRSEPARRQWLEQELDLCHTSWEYQKVLDGELAQRAEKTRQLREIQKQLMLLGGLVPPSPLVTQAHGGAAPHSPRSTEGGLLAKQQMLQADINKHSEAVKELQNQWEVAKQDEEGKGGGAADVRRWTGVRNIVEARELLRSLFKLASDCKGQIHECYMELARSNEEMDILRIMLDTAEQQVAEAKRKALNFELMAATTVAMASPLPSARASGGDDQQEGPDETDRAADQLMQGLGIRLPSLSRNLSLARSDTAAAAGLPKPAGEEVPGTPAGPAAGRGRYLTAVLGTAQKGAAAASSSDAAWLQIGQGLGQPRRGAAAAAAAGTEAGSNEDHQVQSQLAPYAGELQLGKQPRAGSGRNSLNNADLQKQFSNLEELWQQQLQQQQQQGRKRRSGGSTNLQLAEPSDRGGSPQGATQVVPAAGSRRVSSGSPDAAHAARGQRQQADQQHKPSDAAAAESSGTPRGAAAASSSSQQGVRDVDQIVKELYFSDDDPSSSEGGESDDKDADPDYTMTQPRGRRSRSRTSGTSKRLSSASAASVSPDADEAAASTSAPTTAAGGGRRGRRSARVGAVSRQVSLEYEQRQMWQRPVLEHINNTLAAEGRPAVNLLTAELITDMLKDKEVRGQRWTKKTSRRTIDALISDYRAYLGLEELAVDQVSTGEIDRITGSVNWGHPTLGSGRFGNHSGSGGPGSSADGSGVAGLQMQRSISRLASAGAVPLPFSAPSSPLGQLQPRPSSSPPMSTRRSNSANSSPNYDLEEQQASAAGGAGGAQRIAAGPAARGSSYRRHLQQQHPLARSLDWGGPAARVPREQPTGAGLGQAAQRAAMLSAPVPAPAAAAAAAAAAVASKQGAQGSLRVAIPSAQAAAEGPFSAKENQPLGSGRRSASAWR